jgi:hypothetical protein
MRTLCRHTLADIELQLPAAAVAGHAPQLQHAGFRDDGFERDGDDIGGILCPRIKPAFNTPPLNRI